ncbi:acyl-CoA thioesterase II [Marmoricola endophyticus]|uniref:Acyl-CoA thioesterase 2 n=1 Tax=Marmoricola endophyticus TaxID=2040280 RepID=A0A917B9H5_9ACTN|nr:acyl-CoA thioesterase II [Marmoricola endophyticus]GGF32955.1 acyl-CoA thioesterase II [Marmoricola endophyticus]
MPESVDDLLAILDLERIEDTLYRGDSPQTERQRTFGGQVAAQALAASDHTVDDDFAVHSLHSYFLRPGDPTVPIVYDVDDLRDGRSFVTRRVAARQHGKEIYFSTLNYQREQDGWSHQDAMPQVPGPEECPSLADLMGARSPEAAEAWAKEWSALDMRLAGSSVSIPGVPDLQDDEHPGRQRMWIRVAGDLPDEPKLHRAAFTFASDLSLLSVTLLPHGVSIGSRRVKPASLDHSIWFHRPMRADRWWLYDQVSPSAQGGRGLAIGRVFAEDGTLLASVAQEGMIRRVDPAG